MNVLVVDDDRSTRFLLVRTLTKRFACQVTEAGDGDQGLDALSKAVYDLVLLDVRMPVIDGLQMLRELRQSPDHAVVPVVMLTGAADEEVVREVIDLGVTEYLRKPLNIPRLSERLRRILRGVSSIRTGPLSGRRSLARALQDNAAPLLVVDGRAAVRSFFADAASRFRPVMQAESGIQGLRACADVNPSLVFVGGELGVLSEPLFVKRVRATPSLVHLPLIALVDESADTDTRFGTYDDAVARNGSADGLLRQVQDVPGRMLASVLEAEGVHPAFRTALLFAGEQVFATTLSSEVLVRDYPEPAVVERFVVSAQGAAFGQDRIELRVGCDISTARRAAINLFGVDARIVRDDDAGAAVGKVFELLLQTLRSVWASGFAASEFRAPTCKRGPTVLPDPARLARGFVFYFQPESGDQEFWLTAHNVAG
jgi:CheY-like chemotaxis protein